MKRYVFAAMLSLAAGSQAFAADLPPAPSYKAPMAVQQVYNWTGFYIGVNGGWGWGTQDPLNIITNRFDSLSQSISGGVAGGTIGAQIQQGHVVLGLEADLDWANIKGSGTFIPTIGGLPIGTIQRLDKYRLGKHRKGPGGVCQRQLASLWHRRFGVAWGQDHPHDPGWCSTLWRRIRKLHSHRSSGWCSARRRSRVRLYPEFKCKT